MSRVPRIRFKGFEEDWEQRKLGEIVDVCNGRDYKHLLEGDIPVYGTGGYMISVNKALSYDRDAIGIGRKGTIDKPYILNAPFWTVDTLFYVIPKDKIAVLIGPGGKDKIALIFAFGIFQNIDWEKKDESTGVPSLSKAAINEIDVLIPKYEEQKVLGLFFNGLDHLITLHQRKLEKLKIIKKSMLENLFPQNGEKTPKIRFSGFTNDWEQRKLGEVFEEYSEKNHSELPPLTIIQGGGTIRRDESDRAVQYDMNSLSNYKMVNKDDFIVHLRSFEGGLEKANSKGIISPAYHTFSGENTDTTFYYTYFRSEKFIESDLKPHVYGIRDGRSIDVEGMKSINIPYTIFEEQRHIGYLIDSINHLITLHQSKLEKLQKIKKSMLESMFV